MEPTTVADALVVRVYAGARGMGNFQYNGFFCAWKRCNLLLNLRAKVEIMYHHEVKEKEWGYKDVIRWLEDSSFHVILCHMHQGRKLFDVPWDITGLLLELRRLDYHRGFPRYENLQCSIFTQNKLMYLTALKEHDRINYSLFIALKNYKMYSNKNNNKIYGKYSEVIFQWNDPEEVIEKLKNECPESSYCTWVVKYPFKTNHDQLRYVRNYEDLKEVIKVNYNTQETGLFVPYCIIQPKLENGKECKVVCLNGKASHITMKNNHISSAFSSPEVLHKFAEDSIQFLENILPSTILNGLVRVDIMERNDGKLIVNEFESLEAGFEKSANTDSTVVSFIENYWFQILEDFYIQCDDEVCVIFT